MDRPVLHAFVRELVEYERVAELAESLPTSARVSESALPVLLASLHERLELNAGSVDGEAVDARHEDPAALGGRRGLVVLLPEDADARDAAESTAWFVGDGAVGL